MKCKQANEFALSSPFLHSPINIIINDTWEKMYIFHFSASACYFQLTSFPIASRDEIWKHLELLKISMDMIGKHLDELDTHWLTFGNDCLEQWEICCAKNPTQSSLLVVAGSRDSLSFLEYLSYKRDWAWNFYKSGGDSLILRSSTRFVSSLWRWKWTKTLPNHSNTEKITEYLLREVSRLF